MIIVICSYKVGVFIFMTNDFIILLSTDAVWVGRDNTVTSVYHTQAVYMAHVLTPGSVTVKKAGEGYFVTKVYNLINKK